MTAGSTAPVTVATWNIHGCVGSDGVFDMERTGRVIHALGADILALQEVGAGRRTEPAVDVFDTIARAFGGHFLEAKTLLSPLGPRGQLLISLWPMRHRQTHDLTVPGRPPRSALEALIDTPHGVLRVIAAHLGLSARERRRQFAHLLNLVMPDLDMPCLLLGDFNEWRGPHLGYRPVQQRFGGGIAHRTFPALLPMLALDRIWCRPAPSFRRSWVRRQIFGASDHLPVLAEILPGAGRHAHKPA